MFSRRLRIAVSTALGALLILGTQVGLAAPAHADAKITTPFKVNFQTQTDTTPAGYAGDYGKAYSATTGFGWTDTSGAPLSLVGSGRDRGNIDPDRRLDTFVQMQTPTVGHWQASVANGSYQVIVGAGDPSYTDSHDVIHVNGQTAVDFTPTTTTHNIAQSVTVNVTNGFIVVDADGGTNTKIDYLTITPVDTSHPFVTSVDPVDGSINVPLDKSITIQMSVPVDSTTMQAGAKLFGPGNVAVAGFYNTDGASSNVTFAPSAPLAANTTYTISVNSNLKTSDDSQSYSAFTSSFTTGTTGAGPSPWQFTKSTFQMLDGGTTAIMGPDGDLYVGTYTGSIWKYALGSNGMPTSSTELTSFKGTDTITGLAFDPSSTATNMTLWVDHGYFCTANCVDFTGKLSVLTGSGLTTERDVVVGLPRSVKDHMNNGISFGPDGKLYLSQASNSGYGYPDATWGNRAEDPLNASILQLDVDHNSVFQGSTPVNVQTSSPVNYNPDATTAPVKIWTSGTRNIFPIVWASNGKLYGSANESASGNAPDPTGAAGSPGNLQNLPAYDDYATQLVPNVYYGHPNPSRGNYILNGGNPTSNTDPFEVTQYPVGQQPAANWRKPDLDLGGHASPDGMTEYKSTVFGTNASGGLQGHLLITDYSQGKDLKALNLDSNGNIVSTTSIMPGFYNPIGVTSNPTNGDVYVIEHGSDPDGANGQISLLTPNPGTVTPPPSSVLKVNFQTQTTTTPTGYSADFGQAFNTTLGYGWEDASTAAPLSLVGNGRERNVASDKRLDTFMQMQLASTTTGVHTPGKWEAVVPNGTYDVTVAVGDPSYTNSVDVINAEGQNIVNFTPTTGNTSKTVTATVVVSDGRLTLDANGGTNTKIDYVDINTHTAATPPTVTATPSGTQDSSGNYVGSATVTLNTTAGTNPVASTTYTLDGGAAQTYTGPITVNTVGSHTIIATATDNAGNASAPVTTTFTVVAATAPSGNLKVNFQAQTTTTPTGYSPDYGQAFDTTRGYGWEDASTAAPLSLVGNGRERNVASDKRLDTFMQMQLAAGSVGVTTPGKWEAVVPNGTYDVTVAVGDPSYTNSVDMINAEGQNIVNFTPTTGNTSKTVTATVVVSDGRLTLDANGGTNTKIDYVDVVPDTTAVVAPTVTVTPSGTQDSSNNYVGSATVTIATTAGTNPVASTTYTLDGGAAQTYTSPFTVSTVGSHTVVATATDNASNASTPVTSTFSVVAAPGPTALKVNFQAQTTTTPTGYSPDYGQAYDSTRGYGWEDASSGAALSLVGNGRERNVASDKRLDTLMQMQLIPGTTGVTTPGKWEANLANGTYNVTVAVGDPSYTNSVDVINAEGQNIVNFTPTTTTKQQTITAVVTVSDGRLTLDANGGTNTKIDYVDVSAVGADTTPPVVTVNTGGTTDGSGSYVGSATVTINATDGGSGVASTTYTLDGGAAQTYTGPFAVSTVGSHTVVATSIDHANNTSTPVSKTFSVSASGGGTTATSLQVTTPEDNLGLGSRLVFSTIKNQARTGQTFTIKNNGTSDLVISGMSFGGANPTEFKFDTTQTFPFTIAAGATKSIVVDYRPNYTFPSANDAHMSAASLTINSNDATAPNYVVTLGGVDAKDYEGQTEPEMQVLINTLGYKTNVGQSNVPRHGAVSVSSGPSSSDEVISAYWSKLNSSQPVTLAPLAHYSGKDLTGADSTKFGWYAKGSATNNYLYAFPGANSTSNERGDGYGENQMLLPNTTNNANWTVNTSGLFGFVDQQGNYSDDAKNIGSPGGKFHNVRFWQAKDASGNVIPGTYIVGDDIGDPQENGPKNWDYQDYMFLLTNVQPELNDQPVAASTNAPGILDQSLSFDGSGGGIASSGFPGVQGTSNLSKVSVNGGLLSIGSSNDSNLAHTNALQLPFNAGTNFRISGRLVGPFDAIGSGQNQQAIFFGVDATHYLKAEVEWNPTTSKRMLTIYLCNGTSGSTCAGGVSGTVPLTNASNANNANTVDFQIDVTPSFYSTKNASGVVTKAYNPFADVYYSVDGGAYTLIPPTANTLTDSHGTAHVSLPNTFITSIDYAGVMTSNQAGGTPFTANYDSFAVNRWYSNPTPITA